jgi:hypothetical protein
MSLSRGRISISIAMAITALILLFASAAQAATPVPGYERFAGCPSSAENSSVTGCIRSVISGGHFKMGNKNVPITNPISLTGGVNSELGGFVATPDGGLTPVKQEVPGGVIGLTGLDWLINFLHVDALKLYAVTELVGQPTVGQELTLPLRVHLINPVLGNNCYVGTSSAPILLHLISGTTNPPSPAKPISGTPPTFGIDPGSEVLSFNNGVYVDNSFAAPGAHGCQLRLLGFIPVSLDGVVDLASGLPAAAGTNETVQNIDIELAPEARVYP